MMRVSADPSDRRLKSAIDDLRHLSPTLYWKSRNIAALIEWLWRRYRSSGGTGDAEVYDERFWTIREEGDWIGFASLVVHLFAPRSIIDVGCGSGLALGAFRRVDPTLTLLGIDCSGAGLRRAQTRGLRVERVDLAAATGPALRALSSRLEGFDLALCLEVAEHLPPWRAGRLVRLLTRCQTVIFSAAHPNQGGTLHLNEQPAEYWTRRFAAHGFPLHDRNDLFQHELAAIDLPWWYAANANVFHRVEPRA